MPQLVPARLAFMLVGFGVSCIISNVYSLAGNHRTVEPGTALASVASLCYLGFLLGPPMIGCISSATNLRFAYALIATLGLLIAGVVGRLKESKKMPLRADPRGEEFRGSDLQRSIDWSCECISNNCIVERRAQAIKKFGFWR